jgi:hypothetical protein
MDWAVLMCPITALRATYGEEDPASVPVKTRNTAESAEIRPHKRPSEVGSGVESGFTFGARSIPPSAWP